MENSGCMKIVLVDILWDDLELAWDGHFLTHWGQVMHICIVKLTITGSDNGLPPGWRRAIIWTNAGMFLIGPLRTIISEMLN